MSAPSLDAASIAARSALDALTRAHREAAGAAAALANHLAIGLPTTDAERAHRRSEALCLAAAVTAGEALRTFRNAEAHARSAGEIA